MSRPRKWFERVEFRTAKAAARANDQTIWRYTQDGRAGKRSGYFVGDKIPSRLRTGNTDLEVFEKGKWKSV